MIYFLLATSYLLADTVTFTPALTQPYELSCIAVDRFGVTETRSYILPVENPVAFTASVSPSGSVINYGGMSQLKPIL